MNFKYEKTKESITAAIIDEVRQGCKDQGITQGAIGVCFEPLIGAACNWLGIPHSFDSVTFTVAVDPDRGTIYIDENGKEVGDCAGVVQMKICAAKRAIRLNRADHYISEREESTSGSMPDDLNGNGRINWKGCVAIQMGYHTGGWCCNAGTDGMIIYICVSGGKQDQDEAAAWYGLKALQDNFDCVDGFMLRRDYREQPAGDTEDIEDTEVETETEAEAETDSATTPTEE